MFTGNLNFLAAIYRVLLMVIPHCYKTGVNLYKQSLHLAAVLPGILVLIVFLPVFQVSADEVEKILFLVFESGEVVASNTKANRFDRLDLHAKERIRDYKVANATAVVVTNQRFAAYGALAGGWQSKRIKAGEKLQSMEVEDYSATLVTSDRILNFYGRNGTWSEIRRTVQ